MDDFSTLGVSFGLKPQGKAAPMSRPSISAVSNGGDHAMLFDDVFGGPPKYTAGKSTSSFSGFDYNSVVKTSLSNHTNNNKNNQKYNSYSNSSSDRDKHVFDDDIFDGLPGVKDKPASSRVSYDENVFATMSNEKENRNYNVDNSASPRVSYDENLFATMSTEKENRNFSAEKSASSSCEENVFATISNDIENRNCSVDKLSSPRFSYDENVFATTLNENLNRNKGVDKLDELLENLGRSERVELSSNIGMEGFDDLLPEFDVTSPQTSSRADSEFSQSKQASINSKKPTSSVTEDPFVVLESTSPLENQSSKGFPDPLDEISKLSNSTNNKANNSITGNVIFDNIYPLGGFGKSAPVSSEMNREDSSSRAGLSNDSDSNFKELHETIFEMPSISTDSCKFGDPMASPSYVNDVEFNEKDSYAEVPSESDIHIDSSDDAWLNVCEIPLFTQPTSAPPPSRPPPSVPGRLSKSETRLHNSNARTDRNEFYSQSPTVESNMASPIDELGNFAICGTKHNNGVCVDTRFSEEVDTNSSACAAAMKEATDRPEAKFRQTKEVREREYANTAKDGENAQVKKDEQRRENSENEERMESKRRQREEEECRRLERERERAREEREKARQAVERATREARERAATEARIISERKAVQRMQAEARRRAAEIAKEKAEKEATERENAKIREQAAANARAEAEAQHRAERAAVDRAAAEARERAVNAARINQQNNENARLNQQNNENARLNQQNNENARMNQQSNENVRISQQQRNENDLESFFSANSRRSSAPRPKDSSAVDPIFQSRVESETNNKTPSVDTTASMRKTSSAANLFDDLNSIFGGTVSSGDFPKVDGETEERRRTRLDRHQRTQERVAKALAEKNDRDLQSERDQEERHRIGETLDIAIRKWAKGKEGNLRALLSTMQYVLWPECGWTPVSLTDLITGAAVKKVYRKATLCIHPDKVQQKGANLQQKYIAEKVFDLLKEAWNKFNSEELF